jgi:hypothetical protein
MCAFIPLVFFSFFSSVTRLLTTVLSFYQSDTPEALAYLEAELVGNVPSDDDIAFVSESVAAADV